MTDESDDEDLPFDPIRLRRAAERVKVQRRWRNTDEDAHEFSRLVLEEYRAKVLH